MNIIVYRLFVALSGLAIIMLLNYTFSSNILFRKSIININPLSFEISVISVNGGLDSANGYLELHSVGNNIVKARKIDFLVNPEEHPTDDTERYISGYIYLSMFIDSEIVVDCVNNVINIQYFDIIKPIIVPIINPKIFSNNTAIVDNANTPAYNRIDGLNILKCFQGFLIEFNNNIALIGDLNRRIDGERDDLAASTSVDSINVNVDITKNPNASVLNFDSFIKAFAIYSSTGIDFKVSVSKYFIFLHVEDKILTFYVPEIKNLLDKYCVEDLSGLNKQDATHIKNTVIKSGIDEYNIFAKITPHRNYVYIEFILQNKRGYIYYMYREANNEKTGLPLIDKERYENIRKLLFVGYEQYIDDAIEEHNKNTNTGRNNESIDNLLSNYSNIFNDNFHSRGFHEIMKALREMNRNPGYNFMILPRYI